MMPVRTSERYRRPGRQVGQATSRGHLPLAQQHPDKRHRTYSNCDARSPCSPAALRDQPLDVDPSDLRVAPDAGRAPRQARRGRHSDPANPAPLAHPRNHRRSVDQIGQRASFSPRLRKNNNRCHAPPSVGRYRCVTSSNHGGRPRALATDAIDNAERRQVHQARIDPPSKQACSYWYDTARANATRIRCRRGTGAAG